ncbi:MAG TPA: pyruvate formate-lyase [Marinilabiliales bacterium]|nr:pyruvate formate-lyase [Marinilabiliales bacterium]
MNQRIKTILDDIFQKKHHVFRQNIAPDVLSGFTVSLKEQKIPDVLRVQKRLSWVLQNELPVILPGEKIVFMRTVPKIPEIFTEEEWTEIRKEHYIHELGRICNISSNYSYTIEVGLEQRRKEVLQSIDIHLAQGDKHGVQFLQVVLHAIDDIEKLADRYAELAINSGREDIFLILNRIPREGAKTFREALQFFRILHFGLWASGNYHNTVGRFDQYMFKYLKNDLDSGTLDYDSAFELLEEFFISFNKDSDLYPGMQQGDNGQSLVLGGVDENGNDAFNLLSEMCLKASLELKLIDPKINLRVTKNTPVEIYDLGTELTKQGLGFPQYSNDEVVIPGLLSKGYELKDARDYVVAACWEFIIPGQGMDIPNIAALSFARVVDTCVKKYLKTATDFNSFMDGVRQEMKEELESIGPGLSNIYSEPAPLQSLLMNGCIEKARDISVGGKYNNYGIHGTGISTAVDSLTAIKKYVFEEKLVSAGEISDAIRNNFEGSDRLWEKLRYDAPKMGNDDDFADHIAVELLDAFSELTANMKNENGGCFRPGSGSAMYYLWHVKDIGASADGRKKGVPLSANFSPGLNVKVKGPLSIIKSFSKPDMKKIMNGGPLTLELHDTVFRNPESIRKVSYLVKSYMDLGGHQLQINAVNREQLIAAKEHPELYRHLIVRVWGWSGYFTELDEVYQDHIIQRVELSV